MKKKKKVWTDDRVTRLRDLWRQGLSATEIATKLNAEFGLDMSRNAPLGKLHRLSITKSYSPNKYRALNNSIAQAREELRQHYGAR